MFELGLKRFGRSDRFVLPQIGLDLGQPRESLPQPGQHALGDEPLLLHIAGGRDEDRDLRKTHQPHKPPTAVPREAGTGRPRLSTSVKSDGTPRKCSTV